MSTWVCNDFDEDFEQEFSIGRITSFNALKIKCLKIGTVNSGSMFNFKIEDEDGSTLFDQTIGADFINTSLPDNGNRADLVFDIDSFVLNRNVDDTDHVYKLKFSSTNYITAEGSRFMVCRRQADDVAVPITGDIRTAIDSNRALEMPIFFEIFRWSKDSKE